MADRTDVATAIVHVPKCGGTALRMQLAQLDALSPLQGTRYNVDASGVGIWQVLRRNRVTRAPEGMPAEDQRRLFWNTDELRVALRGPGIVIGHVSARDFRRLGARDIRVIVREPRIRLISHFMFWRSMSPEWHRKYGTRQVEIAAQSLGSIAAFASRCRHQGHGVIEGMATLEWYSRRLPPVPSFQIYWDHQLPELVYSLTGQALTDIPLENVTEAGEPYLFTPEDRQALDAAASPDLRFLQRAMDRGQLAFRSRGDLDGELEAYLLRFR